MRYALTIQADDSWESINTLIIEDLKEYIRQADEIIADYENEIANGTDKYDLDYTYQASW